jgi:adenosine deaminase
MRFESMPKVELHLHLEGAIPVATMWELIEGRGGHPDVPDLEALVRRYEYRDFAHVIETWIWMNQFLDSYDAFQAAAEAVAASLASQRIVYAEASYSPSDFARFDLAPDELAMAIRRGLDRIPHVRVGLVADLVRDKGPQRAERTLDAVIDVAPDAGIVGITIGGSEAEFPPEPFAAVYSRARRSGLRLSAHAGEAAGAASVRGALDHLGVDRIGHGIRAVEDPEVLFRLVNGNVPLEVCPSSNLATGVADSWDTHPVRTLIDVGAMVTISSDDPAMFHNSVAGDLEALYGLGYGDATIQRLAENAIEASWAPPTVKLALADELGAWWDGMARDASFTST